MTLKSEFSLGNFRNDSKIGDLHRKFSEMTTNQGLALNMTRNDSKIRVNPENVPK